MLALLAGASLVGLYLLARESGIIGNLSVPPAKSASAGKGVAVAAHPLPDVELTGLDTARKLKLSDLRGKAVLVNFWATWCAPCVQEFPSLLRAAAEAGDKVAFVLVSNDSDRAALTRFLARAERETGVRVDRPNVFVAWDKNGNLTREEFAVSRFPETFIADPGLRIVRKIVGAIDWSSREEISALRTLADSELATR